ncbi:MAG: imidazole glycerol phosphate synthase subunit HisH [Oceanococcaceae bacterium]
MATIGVIDYGMGNLHSLTRALQRVAPNRRVELSYDPDRLIKADRLVLPGVGGVRHCMAELERLELTEFVREQLGEVPLMGICLGMQVLLEYSEENSGVDALGVFPGRVCRFPEPPPLAPGQDFRRKVPHMGWNRVQFAREHPLTRNVAQDSWFYFVHSYYAQPLQEEQVFGRTEYGERFCSVLLRDRVFATQFHPEKSGRNGLQMLANFVNWDGDA